MKTIRLFVSMMFLLLLVLGVSSCSSDLGSDVNKYANAYITIDINPSVEIITNDEGLVESVNALNDDAEILLIDTSFNGKTVDEVVDIIMTLAMETGYIIDTEENAILITTETDNAALKADLDDNLDAVVNKFTEKHQLKMQVHHENQGATKELKAQAEALGISVGKLKLINKAMEVDYELTLEAAKVMAVKDLNRILINARKDMADIYSEASKQLYKSLKNRMNDEVKIKRVELINELLKTADTIKLASILENSTATIEDIKLLYANYYEELFAVKNTYDEEAIIAEILETEDVTQLTNQLMEMNRIRETILKQFKGSGEAITAWEENLDLMEEVNGNLRNVIQAQIKNKIQDQVAFQFSFNEENGELNIRLNIQYKTKINEIKAKYEALFLEKGIELEALEELFNEEIQADVKQFREQFQNRITEMKNEAKKIKEELKEKIKAQKEIRKEICKNNKKGLSDN